MPRTACVHRRCSAPRAVRLLGGLFAVVAVSLVAACGDDDVKAPAASESPSDVGPTATAADRSDSMGSPMPSALVVVADGTRFTVEPFGYGGPNFVADGTALPPSGPAVQVEAADVVVEYPDPGWTCSAGVAPGGGYLTGGAAEVEALGDGRFRLARPGATGVYDVWVHGANGGFSGDFVFRWVVKPAG